jgi:hypothetical protein
MAWKTNVAGSYYLGNEIIKMVRRFNHEKGL